MEVCTKWGIHSPNLTGRISFLHWCTQHGHWDCIRACASAICGNCFTAEMWDWRGEHIAVFTFTVLDELAALDCTCNKARDMSLHKEGMACAAYVKWNGMQESNVCLFCDIWLQVVYLTSFVHAQDGETPLLKAASNGHVEIAQMLMEKGANIEATDKVQLVANVYLLTLHGWMHCDGVHIH